MVSVASLLNHVPSESVQHIQLPPSPMSTSSSHSTDSTLPLTTSASTCPNINASPSSTLDRLVHNSSVHLASGNIVRQTTDLNNTSHSVNIPNTSDPVPEGLGQVKKQKMPKDGAVFVKGKIKGEVNFPPFENLDELTITEVLKFNVYPLGKILEYCRHIPYNSERKTFLEKTGRESFEVFQYIFRVPDDEKEYTVMWDYNTGLVRITPFFKCCKFTKTTPARMLSVNPGLKDITHSITGGALVAQGYWMPYSCALAVCATFCYHIAPALIPIFGPSFPSRCVVPEALEHGRFSIDPAIIIECTKEAERYRAQYSSSSSGRVRSSRGDTRRSETRMLLSPRSTPIEIGVTDYRNREVVDRGRERTDWGKKRERNHERYRDYERDRDIRTPLPHSYLEKRLRLKGDLGTANSPCGSGSTDNIDMGYNSESPHDRFLCSPFTPLSEKSVLTSGSGFDRPYNPPVTPPRSMQTELPSPYLTAVPGGRSPHFPSHNATSSTSNNNNSAHSQFHHHSHPVNTIDHPFASLPHHSSPIITTTAASSNLSPNRAGQNHSHHVREREKARSQWRSKRRITEVNHDHNDDGYDGEHEVSTSLGSGRDASIQPDSNSTMAPFSTVQWNKPAIVEDGPEKNAAWLLVNLSIGDADAGVSTASAYTTTGNANVDSGNTTTSSSGSSRNDGGETVGLGLRTVGSNNFGGSDGSSDCEGPRVKRRKAMSV